jgi:hypothetical protein
MAMTAFFKPSTTWVVDFRHDGHPRRWFKVFGPGVDVRGQVAAQLRDLYGDRARLVEVRPASEEEETQYLRGEEPKNVLCPTGRHERVEAEESPPPTRPA